MRKLPDHIPRQTLCQFGNAVLKRFGFRPIPREAICSMYTQDLYSPPYVVHMDGNTVWIDRFYIATQEGSEDVVYLYISRRHIEEEIISYRMCTKERGRKIKLPDDIYRQFMRAKRRMTALGSDFYISSKAQGLGVAWVDAWAKKCSKR